MSHHHKTAKPELAKHQCHVSSGTLLLPSFMQGTSNEEVLGRTIRSTVFANEVSILGGNPGRVESPPPLSNDTTNWIRSQSYYHVKNVNLAILLSTIFLQEYIRKGYLIALSEQQELLGQDIFALDGYGRMVLNLQKDTYESFGLTGKKSHFGANGDRFLVEIDLRDDVMRDGKKGFNRVRDCLSKLSMNVFFVYQNDLNMTTDNIVFPKSIPPENISIESLTLTQTSKTNFIMPCLPNESHPTNHEALHLADWVGLANLDHPISNMQYEWLFENFDTLEVEKGSCSISKINGFIHPFVIHQLLRKCLEERNDSFLVMTCKLYTHSPFSRARLPLNYDNSKSPKSCHLYHNRANERAVEPEPGTSLSVAGTWFSFITNYYSEQQLPNNSSGQLSTPRAVDYILVDMLS